jgi:hypothetical protein
MWNYTYACMFLLGSTDLEALSNIGGKLFCEFPLFSSSCSQIAKPPPVPWVPLYHCPLLGLREWKKRLWAPTYLVSTCWSNLGLKFVRYKIKINSSSRVLWKCDITLSCWSKKGEGSSQVSFPVPVPFLAHELVKTWNQGSSRDSCRDAGVMEVEGCKLELTISDPLEFTLWPSARAQWMSETHSIPQWPWVTHGKSPQEQKW